MLQGLNASQVTESRRLHGDNVVTPPPRESLWRKFVTYLQDPLIKILLAALLLSFGISVYEYTAADHGPSVFLEPLGIFVAITLATTIGFCLEISANRKFEILNRINDDISVKVIREGKVIEVPRRDIVVGDIVLLDTGDEVPADGKIIDSTSLSINESTLTGEPCTRKSHLAEDANREATYPTDMAMRDTTVIEGHATIQITAVGDATEYGHVFKAAQIETDIKTPLSIQLDRLGKLIAYASYIIGILVVIGRCVIFDWSAATTLEIAEYALSTLMIAITLIVVSVPEGLPMSITMSLALSMRRMLATNNLVRKMHACETMGATTVICTDKTGTLTQNRMSVSDVSFSADESLMNEGIAINTSAYLDKEADDTRVVGNPTEGALLLWLADKGIDYLELRQSAKVVAQIPFSTRLKFMATEVQSQRLNKRIIYVKGAPEIVLSMCQNIAVGTDRAQIEHSLAQYQQQAMRTLGFAYAIVDDTAIHLNGDNISSDVSLVFAGICAISDPVRPEVPAAIKECLDAGIKVKIVTGDTVGTATEIGRQVGLYQEGDTAEAVITGPEWAALSDEEALNRIDKIKIMSRARPADKSRLVSLLQKRGEVVAVTGDGTNDAPALNAAQVGLAMGDGTAVAKEAGDIVIMDNSFASITKAVMWGRSLYQNIRRFILFQLTVNVAACLTVLIGAFTGVQSPLTVTQMLWVNLIMDTFAALALSSLPPSLDVLKQKPRRSDEFIITPTMTKIIALTGLLFTIVLYALLQYFRIYPITSLTQFNLTDCLCSMFNFSDNLLTEYDLTLFFTFFVFLQAWNLMNARTLGSSHTVFHDARDSRTFFGTLTAIVAGQILIVYCGGEMFNVCPIKPLDFIIIVIATSPVYILPMLYKLITRKR
jgi:Ca2+-transporting ATPase